LATTHPPLATSHEHSHTQRVRWIERCVGDEWGPCLLILHANARTRPHPQLFMIKPNPKSWYLKRTRQPNLYQSNNEYAHFTVHKHPHSPPSPLFPFSFFFFFLFFRKVCVVCLHCWPNIIQLVAFAKVGMGLVAWVKTKILLLYICLW